jgi:hypothetical protein
MDQDCARPADEMPASECDRERTSPVRILRLSILGLLVSASAIAMAAFALFGCKSLR